MKLPDWVLKFKKKGVRIERRNNMYPNEWKRKGKEEFASTIVGAFKYGRRLDDVPKPDLILVGCVAVDRNGWRLGKGGGYGDKEINKITKKFGKVLIITTVYNLQIVEKVPLEEYDTKVDYILTPNYITKTI